MRLEEFDQLSWDKTDMTGDAVTGYHGSFLCNEEGENSNLLIFTDEQKFYHLVIQDDSLKAEQVSNPGVRGLDISLKKYRFKNLGVKQFVDLKCNLEEYRPEFTEIVRDLAKKILLENSGTIEAVRDVVESWRSFWANRQIQVLSDEGIIGLLCELKVLELLCTIEPSTALESWKGPLGEKHDFVFSLWALEVKGTRRNGHIHRINGIAQLDPPRNKKLALISFLVTESTSSAACDLPTVIADLELKAFTQKPKLIEDFRALLAKAGYSRLHMEDYLKKRFDIYDGIFFTVDKKFPKMSAENFKRPLSRRISEVSYTIDASDLAAKPLHRRIFQRIVTKHI